jgi:hypothetical protein
MACSSANDVLGQLRQPALQVLQAFLDPPLLGVQIVPRDHQPLQDHAPALGGSVAQFGQLVGRDRLHPARFPPGQRGRFSLTSFLGLGEMAFGFGPKRVAGLAPAQI